MRVGSHSNSTNLSEPRQLHGRLHPGQLRCLSGLPPFLRMPKRPRPASGNLGSKQRAAVVFELSGAACHFSVGKMEAVGGWSWYGGPWSNLILFKTAPEISALLSDFTRKDSSVLTVCSCGARLFVLRVQGWAAVVPIERGICFPQHSYLSYCLGAISNFAQGLPPALCTRIHSCWSSGDFLWFWRLNPDLPCTGQTPSPAISVI